MLYDRLGRRMIEWGWRMCVEEARNKREDTTTPTAAMYRWLYDLWLWQPLDYYYPNEKHYTTKGEDCKNTTPFSPRALRE